MTNYNWNAKDYKNHSQAQQYWAKELIKKLDLKGNEVILDLGCGDGKVTAEIAGNVPSGFVIGVDNSPSMINLAKKQFPNKNHSNLSFDLMDAKHLLYANKFDIVFSNAALHWEKNHQPIIAGIYKALKPGGKILLQMGGKGNASLILSSLNSLLQKEKWKEYFVDFEFPYGFFDVDEYKQLLIQNRFQIDRMNLIRKEMVHEGKSGLTGWIRTTWLPYTNRIPEKYRNEFIDDLVTDYLTQMPLDENGNAHVKMVRLEIEAIKNV